jgi:hypothetical protein
VPDSEASTHRHYQLSEEDYGKKAFAPWDGFEEPLSLQVKQNALHYNYRARRLLAEFNRGVTETWARRRADSLP